MRPIVWLLAALLAGCATLAVGPNDADERAVVRADPRINAGLPVLVALRKVDETEVGILYSGASVAPGPHRLLIDCTVTASHEVARFALEVSLEAGRRYRLIADLRPGLRSCDAVRLVRRSSL